jgi:hypothetical protein
MGKLKLETTPVGASVTIDGKPFPHFTPTEVDGEVGSTLKVGFKLDGYKDRDEDVVIAGSQAAFSVKLDKAEPAAPVVAAAPPPAPAAAPSSSHHEHHGSSRPSAAGKGSISVFVRPWAIVYVDGSRLRQTPVQSYDLAAGKHTLELVNDPKAKREKVQLVIKAGESQEIRRDWDK